MISASKLGKTLTCFLIYLIIVIPGYGQASADSLWSFPTIRTDLNEDGIPDYLGEEVSVSGIVNIESGILHEHYLQTFIQNDTSGISVFSYEINTSLAVGDSIIAWGVIDTYNGLTEVEVDSYRVIQQVDIPAAKLLTEATLNPAKYLGMLVVGEGHIIEKGTTFNGKYILLKPDDISESIMVYVSNFHRLFSDFNFSILEIGDKIGVKGVITEYNPEHPNQKNYKLFLRTADDLNYIGLPTYYVRLIIWGVIAIVLIILAWRLILRYRVDSKTREIQLSLRQKEILLQEIHHRVKNSLSIVNSLIELQIQSSDNKEAIDTLQSSQTRIQSIAMIHEKLYKSESLSDIELNQYIKELTEAIHGTFSSLENRVTLIFNLEPVKLNTDRAIYCGLLINELVVNAFKHAFSKIENGKLTVDLTKTGDTITLLVADNGPGLPGDFDTSGVDSLGQMLINSFVSNLNGNLTIADNPQGGTTFQITFPANTK